ncbi:MAG TPA: acyl carrier protein [Gemmatimonadales bacterium]|nr:acyl carrier protein [Gemmatimonadales bacterium]
MSDPTIDGRVRAILSQVLGVPPDAIGPGFSSESNPEWTSLAHLMLISQIENEFGVTFGSKEISELTSLDRLTAAVTARGA